MNAKYLITITALAFLGFSDVVLAGPLNKPCSPWPECKNDDPEPPPDVLYAVAVTTGPFQFVYENVLVNSKGNLKSSTGDDLVIVEPLGDDLALSAWDDVFNNCAGDFVNDTNIITVGPNDWGIGKNSDTNIHIDIQDIMLEQGGIRKEIQIHLRGIPGDSFLPVCNDDSGPIESVSFVLGYYTIWGKAWSGPGRSWDTCYHFNGVDTDTVIPEGTDPFPISNLTISIDCP